MAANGYMEVSAVMGDPLLSPWLICTKSGASQLADSGTMVSNPLTGTISHHIPYLFLFTGF